MRVSYFDKDKGKRVNVDADIDDADVDAILREHLSSASEKHAKGRANALKKESQRQAGQGTVEIVGDPSAEPEANCTLSGVRPGVDGTYRVHSVSHRLSKKSGFVTTLELRQPQDGAGKDKRTRAGKHSSGSASGPAPVAGNPSLTGNENTNIA